MICPDDQLYEYGAVPPAGERSIEPEFPPKHSTGFMTVLLDRGAFGCVTLFCKVAVQPLASVTTTVYEFAGSPARSSMVPYDVPDPFVHVLPTTC